MVVIEVLYPDPLIFRHLRKAIDVPWKIIELPIYQILFCLCLKTFKKFLKQRRVEYFCSLDQNRGWEAAITNTLSAGDKVLAARLDNFLIFGLTCERLD